MLAITLRSSESDDDKLRFCFRSLDIDNSGKLSRDEMLFAVKLLFQHNPGLEEQADFTVNTPEKVLVHSFRC